MWSPDVNVMIQKKHGHTDVSSLTASAASYISNKGSRPSADWSPVKKPNNYKNKFIAKNMTIRMQQW